MFKCVDCGHVFEVPKTWKEVHDEFMIFPAYEDMSGCPKCEGYYEEVVECEGCDKWFTKEELTDGLCEDCRTEIND